MKLAEVEYTGRMRNQRHQSVTGKTYVFRQSTIDVERVEDMREFARKPNFEVSKTAFGEMAELAIDESVEVREKLEELGYTAKQELAKHFDIKANQSSEDLEDELSEVAESLKEHMESY